MSRNPRFFRGIIGTPLQFHKKKRKRKLTKALIRKIRKSQKEKFILKKAADNWQPGIYEGKTPEQVKAMVGTNSNSNRPPPRHFAQVPGYRGKSSPGPQLAHREIDSAQQLGSMHCSNKTAATQIPVRIPLATPAYAGPQGDPSGGLPPLPGSETHMQSHQVPGPVEVQNPKNAIRQATDRQSLHP